MKSKIIEILEKFGFCVVEELCEGKFVFGFVPCSTGNIGVLINITDVDLFVDHWGYINKNNYGEKLEFNGVYDLTKKKRNIKKFVEKNKIHSPIIQIITTTGTINKNYKVAKNFKYSIFVVQANYMKEWIKSFVKVYGV